MKKEIEANGQTYEMSVQIGLKYHKITVSGKGYHKEKLVKTHNLEAKTAEMEYAVRCSQNPRQILLDCGFE